MIVIIGTVHLREAAVGEAVQAASTVAAASREEPGCVDYRFSIDIDDPLVLRLAEQWESQAALDAHLRTPHFLAFTPVLVASVDGPADFTRFEVSSSGPLLG